MKKITPGETLALSKLIQMESNALAVSKASVNIVSDSQLQNLIQTGITTSESRIAGLQQFVTENNLGLTEGVQ